MNCNNLIPLIRKALKEDIGRSDITTELIIPKGKIIKAVLLAKDNLVVCGMDIAKEVFKSQEARIKFKLLAKDGSYVKKGAILARLRGEARAILTAERVALNFLGLLSGIATATKEYVDRVKPYKTKIADTRKTIPGFRELEKYAVRIGGGYNHRMRLDEMVLVKDNHIKIQNSKFKIQNLMQNRKKILKGKKIEIEVENLKEFKEMLKLNPDIIMLDNMKRSDIREAVNLKNYTLYAKRSTLLEASGGITLKNIRQIAATGVDIISIGALTHSPKSADVSLEVVE